MFSQNPVHGNAPCSRSLNCDPGCRASDGELRDLRRRDHRDHLQVAGLQVGDAGVIVRKVAEDHPVQVRQSPHPVGGVALQGHVILTHLLDERERSRPHRVQGEVQTRLLRGRGRHHHARAVGQHVQQRAVRLLQLDDHRGRIGRGHGRDRPDLAAAGGGELWVAHPVEVVHDGRRVERRAVVKRHIGLQLERVRRAVRMRSSTTPPASGRFSGSRPCPPACRTGSGTPGGPAPRRTGEDRG